jgi:hypothetical protein
MGVAIFRNVGGTAATGGQDAMQKIGINLDMMAHSSGSNLCAD